MRGPDPYGSRDPYMDGGASQGYNNGYNSVAATAPQHSGYSTPNVYMGGGGQDMFSRRSPGPAMGGGGRGGGGGGGYGAPVRPVGGGGGAYGGPPQGMGPQGMGPQGMGLQGMGAAAPAAGGYG